LGGSCRYSRHFAIYRWRKHDKTGVCSLKNWIIEGHGVEPDIFVDNDPAKEFAGIDEQLNKAIEVILEELKTKEKTVPPIPPYPIKKK